MRVPPDGVDDRRLSHALAEHWDLAPARLGYLPVGFGDHHWDLTDSAGRRWFVTVAGLTGGWRGTGREAGYADLRAAMDTLVALPGAGLEFAVAPVKTTDGRALVPLGAEHALSVFPYIDGACVGDELSASERLAVVDMLARLHHVSPQTSRAAPVRSLELPSRPVLEAALGELGRPWHGGPYSEPARQFLARHASPIIRALAGFDELAAEAARGWSPVLTHGEPHSDNILRAGGKLYLIDWDTAGLAAPERDLWMVADADGPEADRYTELTGRRVSTALMRMYRMRWSLDDIMLSLREFRGPHERNGDTELAWEALTEEAGNLLQLGP